MRPEKLSRSYPYAWISEECRLPYGTVLCYSAAVEKEPSAWDVWERAAVTVVDALPPAAFQVVDSLCLAARHYFWVARSRGMAAAFSEPEFAP